MAGHPGATVSPGFAPFRVNVDCAHAAWAMEAKVKDADPMRNVGDVLAPLAFTTHEPDCAEAKVTVNVLALVMATDFGRIHSGGVLLSKHANTMPVEFTLCMSVTEVALVKDCW